MGIKGRIGLHSLLVALILCMAAPGAWAYNIWFVTQGTGGNYQQNTGHLYSWDTTTSQISDRGVINKGFWGDIAFAPNGQLYGVSWQSASGGGSGLYEITPGSSAQAATYTAVSSLTQSGLELNGLEWADGGFWSSERAGTSLYRYEYTGSTWQLSTRNGAFDSGGDLALAPNGTLYAVSDGSNPSNLYTVDRTTGVSTSLGGLSHIYYALAFGGDTLYGFENDQQGWGVGGGGTDIFSIDPVTLAQVLVLDLSCMTTIEGTAIVDNVWGAASEPVVPIPAAAWLFASGLAFMPALRKRAVKAV